MTMPMDKPLDDEEEFLHDEPEEDLPPLRWMEEIRASIERSMAQVATGEKIDGMEAVRKYRAMIEAWKQQRRGDGEPVT